MLETDVAGIDNELIDSATIQQGTGSGGIKLVLNKKGGGTITTPDFDISNIVPPDEYDFSIVFPTNLLEGPSVSNVNLGGNDQPTTYGGSMQTQEFSDRIVAGTRWMNVSATGRKWTLYGASRTEKGQYTITSEILNQFLSQATVVSTYLGKIKMRANVVFLSRCTIGSNLNTGTYPHQVGSDWIYTRPLNMTLTVQNHSITVEDFYFEDSENKTIEAPRSGSAHTLYSWFEEIVEIQTVYD